MEKAQESRPECPPKYEKSLERRSEWDLRQKPPPGTLKAGQLQWLLLGILLARSGTWWAQGRHGKWGHQGHKTCGQVALCVWNSVFIGQQ